MLLEGMFLPVLTPFYGDGRVYARKLEHNVGRYSRTPAAGLVVGSGWGEPERLSDEERREVLRVAAGAAKETKVLLADVTHGSVRETLRLLETAAEAGYDVGVVRVPRLGEPEQRVYLQAVADGAALPLVIDEGWDAANGATLADLAGHAGVLGCVTRRDAAGIEALRTAGVRREVTVTPVFEAVTGRMLRPVVPEVGVAGYVSVEALKGGTMVAPALAVPAQKTRVRVVGFQILAGGTAGVLERLKAGAKGTVQGFAAAAPQASYEVLAAWKDGDEGLAAEKYARVERAARRLEEELGVAGLKAASDLSGYYGGRPRLPGLPLSGEAVREVEGLMRGMRH